MTALRRVGGEAVGDRDDERVAAGAEAAVERADVEQHAVALLRLTDEVWIGQGLDALLRDAHPQLLRAGPRAPELGHHTFTPTDHTPTLNLLQQVRRYLERLFGVQYVIRPPDPVRWSGVGAEE
ncbi:hypothetical protein GCM10009741_54910 [Kribbella lupini]|uniref:Uncharacterized protein n=1 Tax=Kribbella lupini TaxID=291602 RepID=A0ABP4MH76_9ACTN